MKKYTEGTNYSPDWESRVERFFTGIGGSTRCIGVRKLYVGLETTDDHRIPGELCSTEIAGSDAPMLLSLQSQEALGLVVDFVDGTVRSKTLGCTFKAVRGRRNRLIGLKLHPGSFMDSVDEYWVSMMAAEGGAPSDGTTPPPALTPHEPPPRMTQEVRRAPVRGRPYEKGSSGVTRVTQEVRSIPRRGERGESTPSQAASSSRGGDPASSSGRGRERTPRRAEGEEEDDFVYVLVDEEPEDASGIWTDPGIEQEDFGEEEEEEGEDERIESNQSYVEGELSRRGYLDEPTPPYREEMEEDFWDLTEDMLIRHHFEPRTQLFYPNDSLSELPVDISRLGDVRTTTMCYVGTSVSETVEDVWTEAENRPPTPSQEWIGSTTFNLKPLDEELRTARLTWEDGDRKTMTKGQQRRLTKEVNVMEEEDMAMWSTLRGQRIPVPRGWKAMMEVFAGCAVLTSVFQAAGYPCCAPLDILGGWDVHRQADRAMAEKVLFTENPYLLTWAFPCGPWSPWQRLQPEEKTNAKRRQWIPVFSWMYRTIRKHKARGGRTLLENPWLSCEARSGDCEDRYVPIWPEGQGERIGASQDDLHCHGLGGDPWSSSRYDMPRRSPTSTFGRQELL